MDLTEEGEDQELQRALALSLQEVNTCSTERSKPEASRSKTGLLQSSRSPPVAAEASQPIAQPRRGRKQPQYVPSEAEALGCFQECLSPGKRRLTVADIIRVSFMDSLSMLICSANSFLDLINDLTSSSLYFA